MGLGMLGFGGMGGGGLEGGGGPLGMMGMDLGMHKMPIIGGFFQNPNEIHKQQQFSNAGRAYTGYRPEVQQAHMNALGNRMSAYQGANNALGTMYGGRNMMDSSRMQQSPMSPAMSQYGASMPGNRTGNATEMGFFGKFGPLGALSRGIGGGMSGLGF